jgi:hypothetical protein
MYHFIAIFVAAVALMTSGHTVRAMDASVPIGMAEPVPSIPATDAANHRNSPRPMDATGPIGMVDAFGHPRCVLPG